ncbi:RING-type domain-containing protein [Mycena venus]|uniref:RING-type E3 ubiquitin transferase n=1 Tax=Mycena venus TaxID=2733690 RepID=A0A8H6YEM4_9AGAR|nr:RING-type domain-containing protein [Mycena venus]
MDNPPRDEADPEAGINPPTQRARNPIPQFLFISFILFLLTNHNGDEFLARHQYQDALKTLTYQLSNYTAWMNGTAMESNFTVPEQDVTVVPLLDSFKIGGGLLDPVTSSYFSNTTGTFHGDTKFYNITPPFLNNTAHEWSPLAEKYMADANMTLILEKIGTWNWSASDKVALSLVEKPPSFTNASNNVALIHGKIELTDESTSEDLRLEFEGIHFISNGTLIALAQPTGQHVDLRFLPSIVPEASRNATAQIVEPELASRITRLKNLIDAGVIEQEATTDEASKTSCPFSLYMALDPIKVPEKLLREYEEEIQRPAGIWTVDPPPMSISGLLMSKECGILYEFHKAEGIGLRSLFRKLTTYAGTTAITYLILLVLLSRQMQRSRTPSGISRLSFWTFFVQATVDSLSFAGHTVFALIADGKPSLSLIVPAFLACVLFANEAQFAMLIQQFQAPEDAPARVPGPTAPPATATPDGPRAVADAPITATTASPPPPPQPTPRAAGTCSPSHTSSETTVVLCVLRSTSKVRSPNATLCVSFFHSDSLPTIHISGLVLFVFLTVMVHTILSATLSILFVSASYSLFWLPQIVRSARRGRGSGLSKEYLVGTTLCRLYIALYFLLCPKNVLEIEPRPWSFILAGVVCLQMMVVILQDTRLGPTFFLPRQYAAVKIYDYHPVMPYANDPESPDQSLGDCAICMDAIYVDPSLRRRPTSLDGKSDWEKSSATGTSKRKTKGTAGGILNAVQMGVGSATARKNYSLAPCHHLFHTDCLERWLAIKNICPQCRRPLPPL